MLRLRFLGPILVEHEGQPVSGLSQGKMAALLGYLAVRRQPLSREHLADVFWQDLSAARGRANLSWTLHKLSPLLPGCLQLGRRTVEFCLTDACWVDLDAMSALIAQGGVESLTEAAALYRGEFLQGLALDGCADFELWLVGERERWRQRVEGALDELAVHYGDRGDQRQALRYARRLLELAPWREATHRQVMRLLAESGQRGAALAQYEACCRALEAELGVPPAPETEALYAHIRDGHLAAAQPAPLSLVPEPQPSAPPRTLPQQVTPFIGRETQLAEIKALLDRPEVRLLTLTGAGGTGKTRLAVQAAAGLGDLYRDGVSFVSLAPLRDSARVIPTIAVALGVSETGGLAALDALQFALRDGERLLVLDDFEQVLDAGPVVGALLGGAPGLKVLVTSRAPLHVAAEYQYQVPPLGFPSLEALPTVDELAQTEAVALFVQRARQVRPDFALDEGNAPAVAELCARLDGLPLAIELAAARVKLFSPQAMLARLGASAIQFLTGGVRDAPARQRTLRATIEWSYDLLDAKEQGLFAQLSVFVGGATLDAVRAVAFQPSTHPAVEASFLDLLHSLVDQNLLQVSTEADEPRFTMLETIHQYALERLAESGAEAAVRERHARYFLGLAQEAQHVWYGAAELPWMDRLQAEVDNLRAALTWWLEDTTDTVSVSVGAAGPALQLAGALGRFWWVRGYVGEARQWLVAALTLEGADHPDLHRWRAEAASWAGWMCSYGTGDPAGQAWLSESLALWREIGKTSGLFWTLGRLALLSWWQDPDRSRALLEEAIGLARQWEEPLLLSYAWAADSTISLRTRQYERAREGAAASYELASTINAIYVMAWASGIQGQAAMLLDDYLAAHTCLKECVALFCQAGDRPDAAQWREVLGDLLYLQGGHESARECYQESLLAWREAGVRGGAILALVRLAWPALAQGHWQEARRYLAEALALGQEDRLPDQATSACLVGWAILAAGSGRPERAARLLGAASGFAEGTPGSFGDVVQRDRDRLEAALRAQLAPATFLSAWEEGRVTARQESLACGART